MERVRSGFEKPFNPKEFSCIDDEQLQDEVARRDLRIERLANCAGAAGLLGILFILVTCIVSFLIPSGDKLAVLNLWNLTPGVMAMVFCAAQLVFVMVRNNEECFIMNKRRELQRRGLAPKLKEEG